MTISVWGSVIVAAVSANQKNMPVVSVAVHFPEFLITLTNLQYNLLPSARTFSEI